VNFVLKKGKQCKMIGTKTPLLEALFTLLL